MRLSYWIVLAAVLAFSVARFFMPAQEMNLPGVYQAFAHILVGSLLGAWLASKERRWLWLFLGFTAVEIVAFATRAMA
jgi:hypothetical protein